MANLFVVYTPFQFFVAQQVVTQEELQDNILIQSYIKGNKHFIPIYELMKIDGMWEKTIEFEDFAEWNGNRIRSLGDIKYCYRNYKRIEKIIEDNNIGDIYLGEYQDPALKFTNILFSRKGHRFLYFEEGMAHYMTRFSPKETFIDKLKALAYDLFYYLPIYHVRYGIWHCFPNRDIRKGINVYKRYNILPLNHEDFDVKLNVTPCFSEKLLNYMESVIDEKDSQRIMLMTDPVGELIGQKNIYLYYEVIDEVFSSLSKSTIVYIKYHPREPEESRVKIEELASIRGINYKVLSNEVNIPVEYYLQKFSFDKIYIFNASTYFYNGYLYPHCDFEQLLPLLFRKCKDVDCLSKAQLVFLENYINKMDQ